MKAYNRKNIVKYSKAALLSSAALLLASCKYVPIEHYFAEKGTDGDDVMGGEQQNEFVSSAGADTITGSDRGNGLVYYDNSPSAVEIDLLNNVADGGYADGDVLINIGRLFGSEFDDILLGNESNNDIEGEAGNDTIEGRGGKDQLLGNAGDDKINGGDGDDRIVGGEGADAIDGGLGTDVIVFYRSAQGVEVDLLNMTGKGGDAEGDRYINIENIDGTYLDDILSGDDKDNYIDGRYGEDIIYGNGGDDFLKADENATIYGGDGADRINAGDASTLYGGDGDDLIVGGANSVISGGNGMDIVTYSGFRDYQFKILKADNKIMINIKNQYFGVQETEYKHVFDSVEQYTIKTIYGEAQDVDIKSIWNDLSAEDMAEFSDLEANFLIWLGDDAGYNYDGL